jgi:nucleoside-diphosphate-sugar epimerase
MVARTVAITGVGGPIGRRLTAELDRDDEVERIVGLDVTLPTGLASLKLDLRRADVRDRAALTRALAGVDVVVHLAFQVDPLRDADRMRAINVDGTRNVVEVAHELGVGELVHVSSGVVYGAHPDNPLPLSEDQPLRPNTPFSYAEHEHEVERWLLPWARAHPETAVTVLRPSIVAGPGVANFITRQLDAPRLAVVAGHEPPMQFVHVDDVASALAHVIRHRLDGIYNVSSEGWLSFGEVTAVSGRRTLRVPEQVAFSLADATWRLGVAQAPSGQVPYLMYPWVLSVAKLTATGWRPRHSNRDALAEMVREHADRLQLGPIATTRSRARMVLAGVGLVGLGAGVWAVHRARR